MRFCAVNTGSKIGGFQRNREKAPFWASEVLRPTQQFAETEAHAVEAGGGSGLMPLAELHSRGRNPDCIARRSVD